jgi:hypothetical protein
MGVHIAETTVDQQGRVVLDHLPFKPGEKVDVIISAHDESSGKAPDLRGSVLRYDDPFDPVASDDWEALP